jgi:hypothetical protein
LSSGASARHFFWKLVVIYGAQANAGTVPKQMDLRFQREEGSVPANGWDGVTRAVYEFDGRSLKLYWYTNDVANPDPNGRPGDIPQGGNAYTVRLELVR